MVWWYAMHTVEHILRKANHVSQSSRLSGGYLPTLDPQSLHPSKRHHPLPNKPIDHPTWLVLGVIAVVVLVVVLLLLLLLLLAQWW